MQCRVWCVSQLKPKPHVHFQRNRSLFLVHSQLLRSALVKNSLIFPSHLDSSHFDANYFCEGHQTFSFTWSRSFFGQNVSEGYENARVFKTDCFLFAELLNYQKFGENIFQSQRRRQWNLHFPYIHLQPKILEISIVPRFSSNSYRLHTIRKRTFRASRVT